MMNEFIDLIASEGKYTKEELNNKLSTLPGYNLPTVKPSEEICEYLFKKGKSEGQRCRSKVSPKSTDGKHCLKHSPKAGAVHQVGTKIDEGKTCKGVLSKGDRKDEECGKRVSEKCPYGLTCSTHLNKGAILSGEKVEEKKEKVEVSTQKCIHILTTGNNKGNACGVSVTGKSSSTELCTRHASAKGSVVAPVDKVEKELEWNGEVTKI
jgi:hypothetical protein